MPEDKKRSASVLSEDSRDGLLDSAQDIPLPDSLPVLGVDNFVLFPFMIAPMLIAQDNTKQLVDDALRGERLVGVFLKKDSSQEEAFDNLFQVGTLAIILKMLRMPDGSVRLLLHGIERIRIAEPLEHEPYLRVRAEKIEETGGDTRSVQAMMKAVKDQIQKIARMGHLPEDMGMAVLEMHDPGKLADLAISQVQVKTEERQEMLETADVQKRLEKILAILGREVDLFELGSEIQTKVASRMDKRQREFMLREQMKTIRKELGEDEDRNPEIQELARQIEEAKMPPEAQKAAEKEIERLERMHPSSPEYSVSRNYIDWLVTLPWQKSTADNIQIEKAKRILDEDHYDLSDVKERILEYLAVIKLKKQIRGPILCFVGPPGVGKTSLGRSIARALGRKFHRISLGGMRDEAEIRGHRRTYIGSLPGRIIKGIRDCDSNNPLIMLDEVDKIGADFRGDPASALLEVLDPEQNFSFTDHYLDMPFDLSKVMFITTANLLDPIAPPLRDRMEILKLSGYTTREKLEIAKRYLIPRSYTNTGVGRNNLRFTDEAILRIIEGYTREAGVRNLEREIGNICRKVARRLAEGKARSISLQARDVEPFLGPQRVYFEMADRTAHPGVATGLAWTQTGGEILFVEVCAVPGSGQLLLTGQLGEVMKESAMAAVNYLHSNAKELGIPEESFSKQNFHVHVPAGATPKDGPSAGITMATAFCSLLTNTPIRSELAMTGEITLKGNVLPVGGIKEKVLAAHRAGIREIILPRRCEPELKKDVPEEVKRAMRFHFVDAISQVLRLAFPNGAVPGIKEPERPAKPAQAESPPPPSHSPPPSPSPSPPPSTPTPPVAGEQTRIPIVSVPSSKKPALRIEPDRRSTKPSRGPARPRSKTPPKPSESPKTPEPKPAPGNATTNDASENRETPKAPEKKPAGRRGRRRTKSDNSNKNDKK